MKLNAVICVCMFVLTGTMFAAGDLFPAVFADSIMFL
jgi:hypothetical protein